MSESGERVWKARKGDIIAFILPNMSVRNTVRYTQRIKHQQTYATEEGNYFIRKYGGEIRGMIKLGRKVIKK